MRIRGAVGVVVGVVVVLVALLGGTAWGAAGTAGPTGSVAAPARPVDPAAVRAFLDREVPATLDRLQLPGAAVSVVAAGRPVFTGGYGTADVATGRPLDGRTPVRLDSVSKLLTGTAVLQLAGRGELDLHRDVNEHLTGFALPDTFPGHPVTLAHLLTHTGGFEEVNLGNTGSRPRPLGEHLAAHRPARVRPPGVLPAYSNYGTALAGHVVALRAGMPFERYVEEQILAPLGMTRSTFDQSPSHPLRVEAARDHRPEGAGNVAVPPAHDHLSPAGSAIATAEDVGRFMLAHLQGTPVLDEGARSAMQGHRFRADPRLPGMGYAFQHDVVHGHPTVGHDGDGLGSHSVLVLFPALGVGIFAATNGDGVDVGGAAGLDALVQRFAEELLPPGPIGAAPHPQVAAAPAPELAGSYRYTRISTSDPSRLLARLVTDVRVETMPDGSLSTAGPILSDPDQPERVRWVPVGDRLYRAEGRAELLAFGPAGAHLATSDDVTVAWERVGWWQDTALHLAVALAGLVVLLSTLTWPAAALLRRRRRPAPSPPAAVLARWLAGATTLVVVAFLLLAGWLVTPLTRFVDALIGHTAVLTVLGTLPVLAATCTLGVLAAAVLAWRGRWWTTAGRLHYTAVALAAVAFLAVVWEYDLIAPLWV